MEKIVPLDVNSRAACRAGGWEYFWGSPCRKGHDGKRYVDGHCVECSVARATSPDAVAKKNARRRADRSVATAYNEKYYRENREREIERVRVYQEENAKAVRERCKRYRTENRLARAAACKEWREKYPERARSSNITRRERMAQGDGFRANDLIDLMRRQKGKCLNCKVCIKKKYHVDHIMPLAKGGLHDWRNLQLLCPDCNVRKHAKHPIDWAQEHGRLL